MSKAKALPPYLLIFILIWWSFLENQTHHNLSAMDFINCVLNWVVPPASLVMLACSWPALCFINTCEWLYKSFYSENMEDKVVIITGASSGIGEVSSPLSSRNQDLAQ
jgi:hypothetical protein